MAANTRMLQILDRLVVFMAGAETLSYSKAGMDKIDKHLSNLSRANKYIQYVHENHGLNGHLLVVNNDDKIFQIQIFQDGKNQSSYDIIANSTYVIDKKPVYDTGESRQLMYEDAVRFNVFS